MRRAPPLVRLSTGALRGCWTDRRRVALFKGIPYAAAPLGPLRWRPPQPLAPWSGVREASKFGPVAPQLGTVIEEFLRLLVEGQGFRPGQSWAFKQLLARRPQPRESEDCLYLNIRTPALGRASKLPVMVWIHGGDHQDGSGSDPLYQTNTLVRCGVVVVTINYRLGLIGNFAHPELCAESPHGVAGNYGTLDQIAALSWVREHIAAFGGDPERITIFGESAGGESVAHMLTSPLARGLFHRAILQSPGNSGQMRHLRQPFLDAPAELQRGQDFAARLGPQPEPGGQLAALRELPFETLYAKLRENPYDAGFYPVIDGHVLPHSPFSAFATGAHARVPLLIGSNSDEGTLIYPLTKSPLIEYRLREVAPDTLPPYFVRAFGDDLDELLSLYPGLERRERSAEVALLGDSMFGAKAKFYAEHAAHAGDEAYLYMFARHPARPRQTLGATHSAELAYVHGFASPLATLRGPDGDLSDRMVRYWTNFAKSGDPNGRGLGRWAPFERADPRWLHLDVHALEMRSVDREPAYALFNRRTHRHIAAMATIAPKSATS